ncbi:MAG: hypothetical protein FJ034_01485 [Chloroflexi bacterium]|nr:hypothetical protein [Chloroflexota bacterium]
MAESVGAPRHYSSGLAKSGGFPCRYGSCDERFFVARPDSMKDLLAASQARSDHEVEAHGYTHKSWEVEPARPFSQGPAPRSRGKRRVEV